MPNRLLSDLTPEFRLKAFELIARCAEQKIPVFIVNTLRTKEEQAQNIANGVSWTQNSKHLTGNAIDIAPYEIFLRHGSSKLNWDANDPIWVRIGLIGESLNLVWGGRWKQRDMGHFELKFVTDNKGII